MWVNYFWNQFSEDVLISENCFTLKFTREIELLVANASNFLKYHSSVRDDSSTATFSSALNLTIPLMG